MTGVVPRSSGTADRDAVKDRTFRPLMSSRLATDSLHRKICGPPGRIARALPPELFARPGVEGAATGIFSMVHADADADQVDAFPQRIILGN